MMNEEVEEIEEVEEAVEVEEVVEEPNAIEKIAKDWGHRPKDEWDGDEDKWVDAETFVRRERELRDRNADTVKHLHKELSELKDSMRSLAEGETKRLKQALDEQKGRLKMEMEAAVDEGDKDRYKRAEREYEGLAEREKELETPKDPRQTAFEQGGKDFERRNDWWKKEPEMAASAYAFGQSLIAVKPDIEPEEYFESIEKRIRKDYPEYFTNPNRKKQSVAGERAPVTKSDNSWNQLLREYPEAKKVFLNFVGKGVYKDNKDDRERYAKSVLEDEE